MSNSDSTNLLGTSSFHAERKADCDAAGSKAPPRPLPKRRHLGSADCISPHEPITGVLTTAHCPRSALFPLTTAPDGKGYQVRTVHVSPFAGGSGSLAGGGGEGGV